MPNSAGSWRNTAETYAITEQRKPSSLTCWSTNTNTRYQPHGLFANSYKSTHITYMTWTDELIDGPATNAAQPI